MWGCHQCLSEVKDLTGTMCTCLPVGRVLSPSASSPGERAAMAQHVLSEARTLWSEKQGMEQIGPALPSLPQSPHYTS